MDFDNTDYNEMNGDELYECGCDLLDDGDIESALQCFCLPPTKDVQML